MASSTNITAIRAQLELIIEQADDLESRFGEALAQVHPDFHASAGNLIDYIALRHIDIRELQEHLAVLGLSSLGRAEKNVRASVRAVQRALAKISTGQDYDLHGERRNFEQSNHTLKAHIDDTLGIGADGRDVRIMVTLPAEAADEYQLVRDLITSGMDIARINCVHDNEAVWLRMIDNIRKAQSETGLNCRIMMDLAGPKLRTGDLQPGAGVLRIRPRRDSLGRVIAPRRVRFIPEDAKWSSRKAGVVPVPRECIDHAHVGDRFSFKDTRGKKRRLQVVRKDKKGLRTECRQTAYIATGTRLKLDRHEAGERICFRVGNLPPIEEPIVLREGDTLVLHRAATPGEPAEIDANGLIVRPAHISCRQPEVFSYISAGDPIRLNDGKIEGTVKSVSDEELLVEVTHAKGTGSRLRGNKGINFPKSDIRLRGLTETDETHLKFVVRHADAVSLSFVRKPRDIIALQQELKKHTSRRIGVIVKIETVKAFKDLPRLLLATMRHYPAGVMIARGDLAVECGWERLAEIQEEILWMCEAAQLPVIWATQVLERETKKGRPSRAEITDAAMSQRADCVMLNKGPHILAAIEMLDNILRRMQDHQHKKTPKLRKLSITEV
ncbi:MAG: pyruvate kinase [Woeseia sp.]